MTIKQKIITLECIEEVMQYVQSVMIPNAENAKEYFVRKMAEGDAYKTNEELADKCVDKIKAYNAIFQALNDYAMLL